MAEHEETRPPHQTCLHRGNQEPDLPVSGAHPIDHAAVDGRTEHAQTGQPHGDLTPPTHVTQLLVCPTFPPRCHGDTRL